MHQHGELARHRDDGTLARVLSSTRGDRLTVPTQIRVRTEVPDDVVSSIEQPLPAEPITLFSDLHRLVFLARIGTPRYQSEKRAGAAAAHDTSKHRERYQVTE